MSQPGELMRFYAAFREELLKDKPTPATRERFIAAVAARSGLPVPRVLQLAARMKEVWQEVKADPVLTLMLQGVAAKSRPLVG